MKLKGSTVFVLVLLAYTVTLLVMAGSYNPRARLIPELLSVVLIVLLVPLLLQETVPRLRRPLGFVQREGFSFGQREEGLADEKAAVSKNDSRRLIRLLAWFVGFTAALGYVSYLIVVPVFLTLFVRLEGKQKWWVALAVAAVMGIFDYLLFDVLLESSF